MRKKGHADYDHHGHDFDAGEENLDGAAEANAEIIDTGHNQQPTDCQRLRPSENKIVGFDPAGETGNGNVYGEERKQRSREKGN